MDLKGQNPHLKAQIILSLGPTRVAAMTNIIWCTVEKGRGFCFVNYFAAIFPGNLKDENLRNILPKFRGMFRRSLAKISQEPRSGGLLAQLSHVMSPAMLAPQLQTARNLCRERERGKASRISSHKALQSLVLILPPLRREGKVIRKKSSRP